MRERERQTDRQTERETERETETERQRETERDRERENFTYTYLYVYTWSTGAGNHQSLHKKTVGNGEVLPQHVESLDLNPGVLYQNMYTYISRTYIGDVLTDITGQMRHWLPSIVSW
jgi:hypothetical protein